MLSGEDFLLENLGPSTLVHTGDFEYLGRIDIGICSSAHYGYATDHTFVYLKCDALRVSIRQGALRALLGT